MAKNVERLKKIYAKTDGYCHICHQKLNFSNHGSIGVVGAWHIEHSKPKASGGTDHLNNLFPACIGCNLKKGTKSTRLVRAKHGNTRAPYSNGKKESIETGYTLSGTLIGATIGAFLGPPGILLGSVIGGLIGSGSSPSK